MFDLIEEVGDVLEPNGVRKDSSESQVDALDDLFLPDAIVHYDVQDGTRAPWNEMKSWLPKGLEIFRVTQHNMSNPMVEIDLEAGQALYQACFTKDAAIAAVFPDGRGEKRTGPEAWADFVLSVFKNAGYTVTQHLLGTIDIEVTGETATMNTYLHATHVLPNGSIDVANGTYADEVVKTPDGWRIRSRTLTLITFLHLASPTAPSQLLSQ